jgi:putative AbiEii toxin of type IV toxin-antitoxin system/AAA ATPase-like protein
MASKIIVEGFKSIGKRVEVEVRPLTLLAGANSSGKSSLMQAILLLKQTLEAPFDPGPLLLNGPNVKLTEVRQLLHSGATSRKVSSFTIGLEYGKEIYFETRLSRATPSKEFGVSLWRLSTRFSPLVELRPDMSVDELQLIFNHREEFQAARQRGGTVERGFAIGKSIHVVPQRFALELVLRDGDNEIHENVLGLSGLSQSLSVIHIPGLRGNPERSYPLTATGPRFTGTFEQYTASIIAKWKRQESSKLVALGKGLQQLGLTWKVEAKRLDDANVELRVGRVPRSVRGGARDLVNIADVGFGVSQTLPVLVALLEARPGQLVFIEQPEIHLHPKAQVAMAGLLADAAKRGVQLVIETHSSLLLLAVQTLVAEGDLDPELVKLQWFTRDVKTGATKITSADLDEAGRFGEWPEDFDDVSLNAQSQYLNAVTHALRKK